MVLGRSRLLQVAEVLPQRLFHEEQGFCKIADLIRYGSESAEAGQAPPPKIVFGAHGRRRQFLERLRNPSDQKR